MFNSFSDVIGTSITVVAAESWNFGKLLTDSFGNKAQNFKAEAEKLKNIIMIILLLKLEPLLLEEQEEVLRKKQTIKV